MDVRPDTSSGRSQDGWSFLNHGNASSHDAQARSVAPSSYLRSDRSSVSPLPNGLHTYNGSRSSFSRNIPSASTGARSTTTVPSQPVLLRINSAPANDHNHRTPRRSRRPIKMDHVNDLPTQDEFGIQGILSAIREDIEVDVNTISEILGRSRFMLADQYESQLPPQGEITMRSPLQGIEEATPGDERLAVDDVAILHEDASLVEGSNSGSAAYRLMERLQTVPRPTRINSDAPAVLRPPDTDAISPVRTHSSPPAIQPEPESSPAKLIVRTEPRDPSAVPPGRGPAQAVVSETYVSAEANGVFSGIVPIVSEAGRHYPLYTHDETGLFETTTFSHTLSSSTRRSESWLIPGFSGFTSWFSRGHVNTDQGAEARLRDLLNR